MTLLKKAIRKARMMTLPELAGESMLRARRALFAVYQRRADTTSSTGISDQALLDSLAPVTIPRVITNLRARPVGVTPGITGLTGTTETIRREFPESVFRLAAEATEITAGRVSIFEQVFDFGVEIDWHRDPINGAQWPAIHRTRVPITIGGGSDVRVLWELNRMHQMVTLGAAYSVTADEQYARAFTSQFRSWVAQNPPRFGINWANAMEAAIRAVNMTAACQLFRSSNELDEEFYRLFLKTMLAHGRFIETHLEFSHSLTSNHYLSNLIGLFIIGLTVPNFRQSPGWVVFATNALLREMDKQILADGTDYEGSTGYHRLVLEIYALFFSLSRANSIAIPERYWHKLEGMFDFARSYVKPDGTAPLIGDSDDGRLLKFKSRPAVDHSYLLSLGAMIFGSERFKQADRVDEEAIWWHGEAATEAYGKIFRSPVPGSKGFGNSQIFVLRSDDVYCIIDCGDSGAKGRGSHAHSDALSFELYAHGRTLLRDPGTFLYTGSEIWRNSFRSTASHNTVRVDENEISIIDDGSLFGLGSNVKPVVHKWETGPEQDIVDAEHHGYLRLKNPVAHRRTMQFFKRDAFWLIDDALNAGRVRTQERGHAPAPSLLELFFNFDAGIDVKVEGDTAFGRCTTGGLAIVPVSGHRFETRVASRWVSLSFASRAPSVGVIYRLYAAMPFRNRMLLIPFQTGDESKVERIVARFAEEVTD